GDDALPLIALNLNPSILDRSPGPAALLQRRGEIAEATIVQLQTEHCGHTFPTPSGCFASDLGREVSSHRFGQGFACWNASRQRDSNLRAVSAAEDSRHEPHDLLFDQTKYLRGIVHVPELHLRDPRREPLLQQW